jgi:FAD/FMN-containing dehydrogenase
MHRLPNAFLSALRALLPPDAVYHDADTLLNYGRDWTRVFAPDPSLVVFPSTAEQVAAVLGLANEHQVAVVPSGGRTGLAGGAMATQGEVVVSLQRLGHMRAVDTLGGTVCVGAGAITEAVHAHCAPHGLTWPIDFASKGSSQVGGNIATNAGGLKVIRYGLTRQWVMGLQVALCSGQLLQLGGPLEKNNTGMDLRQLFIGSEGTLGIVTAATLKLCALPGPTRVMLFALPDLQAVLKLFQAARSAGLTLMACEFFDARCMQRLHRHRHLQPPFAQRSAYYLLLEVEGLHAEAADAWLQQVFEAQLCSDGVLASTGAQEKALWALREGISESLSATGLPHKNDIALPLQRLEAFCKQLDSLFQRVYPAYEVCVFGHIGDGNLHVNVMQPEQGTPQEFFAQMALADQQMFALVQKMGGSISAEHGIGLLKKNSLHFSRTPEEIKLMRDVKKVLDPLTILNPGKVFSE